MTDTNFTGGCQCGRVRYASSGAARRRIGLSLPHVPEGRGRAVHRACAASPRSNRLDPRQARRFRSSTIATRLFCADCGTPLAYVNDGTGALELTTGSLDDPERARPTRATGTEGQLHWLGG